MTKAYEQKLDLSNLTMHLDIQMRNYLRNDRIGPETHNRFENIEDPSLSAIYLSHFLRVMAQRQDFYSDYDQKVKTKQVQDYCLDWQKHLLKDKSTINQRSKNILKNNFA